MPWQRETIPFVLLVAIATLISSENLPLKAVRHLSQAELGMMSPEEKKMENRAKSRMRRYRDRPESEMGDLQTVTIDLSALRPSLPGLVLYKYGDLAPKLVQIDLDALNPDLQPHIIWPQFTQQAGHFGDSYVELVRENFGPNEDIPFLSDEISLAPAYNQRFAKLTAAPTAPQVSSQDWPNFNDLADGDIYDFLPGSARVEELMNLHKSLPLADEVIIPLDWEEDSPNKERNSKEKKNVFVSRGWKAGGEPHPRIREGPAPPQPRDYSRSREDPNNLRFVSPFGTNGWRPGKRQETSRNSNAERELESEEFERSRETMSTADKKDDVQKIYGHRRPPVMTKVSARNRKKQMRSRISGQESLSVPKKQWGIPQLFSPYH